MGRLACLGVCAGLVALVGGGCFRPPPETHPFGAPQYEETEVYHSGPDFAMLRGYDMHSHTALPRVLDAAERLFSRYRFNDMPREELKEKLGPPYETVGIDGVLCWDYVYDDGEGEGIYRRFKFYTSHGVQKVLEVVPMALPDELVPGEEEG